MVTYLGSLVQLSYERGGTLQTNITCVGSAHSVSAALGLPPLTVDVCVFIFICFYAYFYFFSDFFCDLLVIQQRVVQPPYVGIFNSFSPVIEI